MAKGQKKSNKEVRKPKADKPKAAPAARSFLTPPSAPPRVGAYFCERCRVVEMGTDTLLVETMLKTDGDDWAVRHPRCATPWLTSYGSHFRPPH